MALTLDPSKRNDIIIRQGQSLNFSFLLTNESDGEDFAVAGYTFNLEIYDRRRTKIFDLTDGEGLTVQDGSVAVSISANDLNIPDGDYKYFLVVTNPDAETNTWINGYAKVKDSLSIGSQDDVSVTVSNADNNVNITVGISGSTLSAGDQAKIDNLPENTTQELAGKADNAVEEIFDAQIKFDKDYGSFNTNTHMQAAQIDFTIDWTNAKFGKTTYRTIVGNGSDITFQDGAESIITQGATGTLNGFVFTTTNAQRYVIAVQSTDVANEKYIVVIIDAPAATQTQLSTPSVVLTSQDSALDYSISNEDANATGGIFTYDTNSDFSTEQPVPNYEFNTKSGTIPNLTNGVTYYVRLINTAPGYANSDPGSDSETPNVFAYQAETEALEARLTAAGATVTTAWKDEINNLFLDLKINGSVNYLTKINTLQIYYSLSENGAMFNWITDARNGAYIQSPVFTLQSGIQTNGTDSGINSGVNPNSHLSQNDCFIGVKASNFTLSGGVYGVIGANQNSSAPNCSLQLTYINTVDELKYRINDFTDAASVNKPVDWMGIGRNGTTKAYRRNAGSETAVLASAGLPNLNIHLGGVNIESTGGLGVPLSCNYLAFYTSDFLTESQFTELNGFIDDYITAISGL